MSFWDGVSLVILMVGIVYAYTSIISPKTDADRIRHLRKKIRESDKELEESKQLIRFMEARASKQCIEIIAYINLIEGLTDEVHQIKELLEDTQQEDKGEGEIHVECDKTSIQ